MHAYNVSGGPLKKKWEVGNSFFQILTKSKSIYFRSTLIGVTQGGFWLDPESKKTCNPADEMIDKYARITDEIMEWIREITKGAKIKKSNCDDIQGIEEKIIHCVLYTPVYRGVLPQ